MSDLLQVFSRLGALEEGQRRVDAQLVAMDVKLDKLLAARSFVRGAWWTATKIAAVVIGIATFLAALARIARAL